MTTTNVHNIDEAIAKAITSEPFYDTPDCDISITGLVRPPQVGALEQEHQGEITEDVSDRLWSLLGQAVHEIVRRADLPGALQEERLFMELEGWRIAGKTDIYQDGEIRDFKVTSVWAFLMGDKPDWEAQLNFYAVLWRANAFPVTKLTISAILRDWTKREAQQREGYPPIPFMSADVPLWQPERAEAVMRTALLDRQAARAGRPRPCTDEERWRKADAWAVKKAGQKTAVAVFGADKPRGGGEAEALSLAEQIGGKLEHRPGEDVRCESYCAVSAWCPQWKFLARGAKDGGGDQGA